VTAGAVLVVLALVAATFALTRHSTDLVDEDAAATAPSSTPSTTRPSRAPSATGPSAPAPTPADPDAIRARARELQRFVERERGLPFTRDVEVEVLETEAFKTRVLAEFDKERPALETQGRLLQATGLLPADLDAVEAQRQLLGDGVLGFYDPVTEALVVRGSADTPMLREIMVHELTHALEDQHFDLDRPELAERRDGSDWGFLALVEGSARRIEYRYVDQLSEADRTQLDQEQLQLGMGQIGSLTTTPMVLPQLLMAPYDYGRPFVQHLVDTGGQARLDAAFAAPPTSSEQIVEPARFDAGDTPKAVAVPPADGPVVDEGVLGTLLTSFVVSGGSGGGLDEVLGGLLGQGGSAGTAPGTDESLDQLMALLDGLLSGETDPSALEGLLGGGGPALPGTGSGPGGGDLNSLLAPPMVTGWGGDRYVVWSDPQGDSCIRVDWVGDTPADAAALRSTLTARAGSDPAMRVEAPGADTVRLTRCAA
jgi:hypothetical protein